MGEPSWEDLQYWVENLFVRNLFHSGPHPSLSSKIVSLETLEESFEADDSSTATL